MDEPLTLTRFEQIWKSYGDEKQNQLGLNQVSFDGAWHF